MPFNGPKNEGPDPAIQQAIARLSRTQLTPLEETMFQAWTKANQIDDPDNPDVPTDFRSIYKETGGKVLPPGQLKNDTQRKSDIEMMMEAQKAHDSGSPMKLMMDKMGGGQEPQF